MIAALSIFILSVSFSLILRTGKHRHPCQRPHHEAPNARISSTRGRDNLLRQSQDCRIVYQKRRPARNPPARWNIPTFGKRYRALGGPCAFLRASEGFWSMFCRECECLHPVSSSNSICKSPHSSRGHLHPRHFPWRTRPVCRKASAPETPSSSGCH